MGLVGINLANAAPIPLADDRQPNSWINRLAESRIAKFGTAATATLSIFLCLSLFWGYSPLFGGETEAFASRGVSVIGRIGSPLVLAIAVMAHIVPRTRIQWALTAIIASAGVLIIMISATPLVAFLGYIMASPLIASALSASFSSLSLSARPEQVLTSLGAVASAFLLFCTACAFSSILPIGTICLFATPLLGCLCIFALPASPGPRPHSATDSRTAGPLHHICASVSPFLPLLFLIVATAPLFALVSENSSWPLVAESGALSFFALALACLVWFQLKRRLPNANLVFCMAAGLVTFVSLLYQDIDATMAMTAIGFITALMALILCLACAEQVYACAASANLGLACLLAALSLSGLGFGLEGFAHNFGEASYRIVKLVSLLTLMAGAILCFAPRTKRDSETSAGDTFATSATKDKGFEQEPSAVSLLAASYRLNLRQQEILFLLAAGRNVPFIAEELHLSPNTVKTYKKELYSILDVHTQQELIDLVEYYSDQPKL